MNTKCRLAIETYGMLSRGDRVVVALSGGADSCAMLHFLHSIRDEFALELTAVHVNHMIRGDEAERDASFAEAFCRGLDVPFRLYRRNVPALAAERGMGLEECGRAVRYEVFAQEAACGGKIATAHTLSDSVETVLFHMIRGCSTGGLRGIPPVRDNIIRPLILCRRDEIEAYCAAHHIAYVTDSTNASTEYARNKIRLQILPLMREINPAVIEALDRLSLDAAQDDAYLCELSQKTAAQYLRTGEAAELFSAPSPVVSRALTAICRQRWGITPEHRHVAQMMACLRCQKGSVNLTRGHRFIVKKNRVYFSEKTEGHDAAAADIAWSCNLSAGEIITPYGQKIFLQLTDKNKYDNIRKIHKKVFENALDYDKIEKASFRFRKNGDTFRQAGRGVTKSLKKLFNERAVPVGMRSRLPLLECGGRIAWICGVGVGEDFAVTEDTRRVLWISTHSSGWGSD